MDQHKTQGPNCQEIEERVRMLLSSASLTNYQQDWMDRKGNSYMDNDGGKSEVVRTSKVVPKEVVWCFYFCFDVVLLISDSANGIAVYECCSMCRCTSAGTEQTVYMNGDVSSAGAVLLQPVLAHVENSGKKGDKP